MPTRNRSPPPPNVLPPAVGSTSPRLRSRQNSTLPPSPSLIALTDPHPFINGAPLFKPLLFSNIPPSSNARDHAANERTFLSLLRLSVYLAVVSLAVLTSYHLKHQPSSLERKISLPVGVIFFVLSLATLAAAWVRYVRTVVKYARKRALVQSGKLEIMFIGVGVAIVVTCALFLGAESGSRESGS